MKTNVFWNIQSPAMAMGSRFRLQMLILKCRNLYAKCNILIKPLLVQSSGTHSGTTNNTTREWKHIFAKNASTSVDVMQVFPAADLENSLKDLSISPNKFCYGHQMKLLPECVLFFALFYLWSGIACYRNVNRYMLLSGYVLEILKP